METIEIPSIDTDEFECFIPPSKESLQSAINHWIKTEKAEFITEQLLSSELHDD